MVAVPSVTLFFGAGVTQGPSSKAGGGAAAPTAAPPSLGGYGTGVALVSLSPLWRKRSLERAGAKAEMRQAKAVALETSQPSPKSHPRGRSLAVRNVKRLPGCRGHPRNWEQLVVTQDGALHAWDSSGRKVR